MSCTQIHLCVGVRVYTRMSSIVLASLLKRPFFIHCVAFAPMSKSVPYIYIGLFLDFSILLICLFFAITTLSWLIGKELTQWNIPWFWERLNTGGEGGDRGWDGWMASSTQWTWVWASSGSWWWTGKPGVLQSIGSQRVGHDWVTELTLSWCGRLYNNVLWRLFALARTSRMLGENLW